MLETNKNSGRDGNEKPETITVVPHKERRNETKPASPSWFVAKINPVSRFIGALILCIPMFFTLDVVSASVAFGLEMLLLWIGGVAPWTVLRKTWPVWIAATGSFVSVALYGKTSGTVLANLGGIIVISQGSLYLALATFLRVAAIAVPGVFWLWDSTRPICRRTRADSAPAATFRIRAALPACACSRCCRTIGVHSPVTPLAWPRRRQHHQTRLLASIQPARRIHPTWNEARHRHGSARIRIRRATKPSARIETACGRLAVLRHLHRGAGNRVGHRILHRLLALGVQQRVQLMDDDSPIGS